MDIDTVLDTVYTGPDVVFTTQLKQPGGKKYYCKQLPVAYQQDNKRLDQFDQEIKFMESLGNIQGTLIGRRSKVIGDNPAIVYDYMEYHSVGKIINDCVSTDQRIPLSLGISWSLSIIESLEQLMAISKELGRSTIDIAIWPQTLFIDDSGNLRITHFSLNSPPSITSSIIRPDLKQYFLYAAPEQIIAGQIPDQRILYYILGMLLFELLTSKPLFTNPESIDPKQVVRRKLRKLHPLLSDVNSLLSPLDKIISEMLTPHPDNRLVELVSLKDKIQEFKDHMDDPSNCDPAALFCDLKDNLSHSLGRSSILGSQYETTNINEFNAS